MSAGGPQPMTPELAARNRRIILSVAVVFVITSVAVFAWGLGIVGKTRERARAMDASLRSTAWSILCYAEANGGTFPTGEAALAAFDAAAAKAPAAGDGWPATREAAMDGLEWLPPAKCGGVGATWPSGGANPGYAAPQLNTKGEPSGFGTLETVNGWLAAYARARVAAPAAAK